MRAVAAVRPTPAPAPAPAPARNRSLRVVHVITALDIGGAERQLQWITAASVHSSSTIALYAGGPVADAMTAAGADVDIVELGRRGKLRGFVRLVRMLRRVRPEVVHVHLLAAQLWGIPAARLAGVRTVISSEHSLMDTNIENRPLTPLLRRVYLTLERMSTHTIAVSDRTRRRLISSGVAGRRITVVDNGIDFESLHFSVDERTRVRAEWGVPDAAQVVGAVGRLEAVKRLPELLTALAPTLSPSRYLVIAGDGPQQAELAELAAQLGVTDQIRLLGPRRDMRAVLSGFDALISPSLNETFGMAVVEALACGLPVAYAQCPALEELDPRPAWAIPIDTTLEQAAPIEAEAIRRGVDQALGAAGRGPGGRFPVPAALTERYGVGRAAAAIDELYRQQRRSR